MEDVRVAPKVVIVDDDTSVRQSMRRLVCAFGFEAVAFGSAEEFLASGLVDATACLVLDVRMPGMDGLELQRRLAAEQRRIPIVFITAFASDDEERRAREAGAITMLRKPVDKDALLDTLRAAVGRSS